MAQAGRSEEIKGYQDALDEVNALLEADPDNVEYNAIRAELEANIAEAKLNEDETDQASPPPPPSEEPVAPAPPKWDPKKHPAYIDATKPTQDEPKVPDIKTNDVVMGKWPGDGRDYKAKVISIMGSRNAPMYTVKWTIDNSTDNLSFNDIRPIHNDQKKRKADVSIAALASQSFSSPAVAMNPGKISAPPNLNAEATASARPEPSKVSDGPTRPAKIPKKISNNKTLEGHKSNWADFQKKGKHGKKTPKESMFRTGDSFNARVGFTGSGKAMQKDPTRTRHIYEKKAEEE